MSPDRTPAERTASIWSGIRRSGPDRGPHARKDVAGILALLGAVVGSLLLVACANLANLFLARGAARRAEIGVRIALGARFSHLLGQLLWESGLIALAGTAAALLTAQWTARAGLALAGESRVELPLDALVFLYTLLLGAGAAAITGAIPAFQAARTDPIAALRGQAAAGARSAVLSREGAFRRTHCDERAIGGRLYALAAKAGQPSQRRGWHLADDRQTRTRAALLSVPRGWRVARRP